MNMIIKLTKYTNAVLLFLLVFFVTGIQAQTVVKKAASDSLNFLYISDFGGQGGKVQCEVGLQLGRQASNEKSSFVITGGDNYHQNGLSRHPIALV